MKRLLLSLLFFAGFSLPAMAQHKTLPVEVATNTDGKRLFADFKHGDLRPDPPPQISISQEVVVDYQCVSNPGLPPAGLDRLYCDSGTGQMTCLTSTGANCLNGGGAGGPVTSVGLAGPTGIVISGSPVTTTGTLTFGMPTGWIQGDLLDGNGANSVARVPAPTTPNGVAQTLVSTPSGGVGQQWVPALAGLAGRVVSTTTDTILATDRQPGTVEYRSNASVAVTVPDPGSAGFTTNPSFAVANEFAGAVTFTPASTAVITYCSGSVCFQNEPSLTLLTGQYARWSSPDNNNWLVFVTNQGQATTCNDVLLTGGGVTWTGGLNFTVSAATYCIAGTTYSSPQTNLTLSTADPSNPRIDVIAVNSSGAAVVITGTPAGSPAAPSVDPTTQLSLTFVTVPAGSSTPTITSITVYDENAGTPTEWNCTPSANFNCNSTNNPFHLTHDIEATTAANTNNVVLADNTTVNLSTYSTLSFNIRNKAAWPSAKSVSICFKNGSTVVGTCIGFKNGVYGFNQAITTAYQQIVIPLSAFALGSTVVDRVVFTVVGGGGSIGFYLDWIQLQTALSGGGGNNNFQLQVNGANTQQTANFVNNGSVTFSCTVANSVSTCTATAVGAPPSGTAGGDLSGTYPNPTVAQVNGGAVPASAHVVGTNSSKQIIAATQTDINAIGYVAGGGTANAQTATLAPAITGLTNGLQVCWLPSNANASTTPTLAVNGLTAKTIVKVGGAALAANDLTTTAVACAIYDGTNFELQNPQTGAGISQAYQTIDSNGNAQTQRSTVNFISNGGSSVSCVDNSGATRTDCTVTSGSGGVSPVVRNIGSANYIIQNGDNAARLLFSSTNAITLPQANQISSAPFVSNLTNGRTTCTGCTTASFTPTAGKTLYLVATEDTDNTSTATVTSPDSAGNVWTLVGCITNGNVAPDPICLFQAVNVLGSATTVTFTWSTSNRDAFWNVVQYTGITPDASNSAASTSGTSPAQATVAARFPTEMALYVGTHLTGCSTGYSSRGAGQIVSQVDICDAVFNGVTSITSTVAGSGQATNIVVQDAGSGATVTFPAGWYTTLENTGTGVQVVTPTTSTINGQTTLNLYPNESCTVMSDGVNYNAICHYIPNEQSNGTVGASITIQATPQTAGTSSIGATTILATPSAPVSSYEMSGYAEVTVVGSSCAGNTTVVLNAIFTSPASAGGTTTVPLGTFTITTNGVVGTSNASYPSTFFRAKGSTNIQFSTTYTAGGSCSPAPTVQVTPILQVK